MASASLKQLPQLFLANQKTKLLLGRFLSFEGA